LLQNLFERASASGRTGRSYRRRRAPEPLLLESLLGERETIVTARFSAFTISIAVAAALAGCSSMDMGNTSAKTEATGSAGGVNSQGANNKLEHCKAALGTIAVVEDTDAPWYET